MAAPMPDLAIPAPGPLVVFAEEFDVLACTVREARYLVRKLEADLMQAKQERDEAEAVFRSFVERAANG